jgi:hypothetical protein
MIWVLVILTMVGGEPVTETMTFDTSSECYSTAAWVRRVANGAKTVCFDIKTD